VKSDLIGETRVRVVVRGVASGSPAAAAGVRRGDVVEAVGAHAVETAEEYRFRIRDLPVGAPAQLRLARAGRTLTASVTGVELSPERVEALVAQATGVQAGEERVRGSTVVTARTVRRDGAAARMGVQAGDWLREVNGREVSTLAEWRRALVQARRSGRLVLLVQRGRVAERLSFDID
jgi:S1-C subfamily serine protease